MRAERHIAQHSRAFGDEDALAKRWFLAEEAVKLFFEFARAHLSKLAESPLVVTCFLPA
jgi:hypothetical protein